jgi:hypothetical protein
VKEKTDRKKTIHENIEKIKKRKEKLLLFEKYALANQCSM